MPRVRRLTIAELKMTASEMDLINRTADLYKALEELEWKTPGHPEDLAEHARDIHNIQNRIMARVARRLHPETFV